MGPKVKLSTIRVTHPLRFVVSLRIDIIEKLSCINSMKDKIKFKDASLSATLRLFPRITIQPAYVTGA
jgi:hypothetical protein